jgi:hypothetical protein
LRKAPDSAWLEIYSKWKFLVQTTSMFGHKGHYLLGRSPSIRISLQVLLVAHSIDKLKANMQQFITLVEYVARMLVKPPLTPQQMWAQLC